MTDDGIRQRIALRMLMAECSKDDPVVYAHMLYKVKKIYTDEGMRVPDEYSRFLASEARKISSDLRFVYENKKKEYDLALASFKPKVEVVKKKSKNEDIFGSSF